MSHNTIDWNYIGGPDDTWQGKSKGLLCHIVFTLSLTHKLDQEYFISSNYKRIRTRLCIGTTNAKQLAQDMLNSYSISLSIP